MTETTPNRRRQAARLLPGVITATVAIVLVAVVPPVTAQQGLSGPGEGETLAQWTSRWLDGPVQLIATDEEKELFASLDGSRGRLQFIRLFWERRDPQVRGPRNEFLDTFTERLAHAEEEYANSREPAWRTVFGQVVMLFGPPDRTRRELGLGGAGFSDRPPILWSYDARIPGLDGNEDLLFVFRAGRWKLMPPSPIGAGAIPEALRDSERNSVVGATIPNDYLRAMDDVIKESLVNLVDYGTAVDVVTSSVRLPEAQIPFSYTSALRAGAAGNVEVEFELTWRVDSLIFHLVDGAFTTEMLVEAALLKDGEPAFVGTERVNVVVPEAEMEGRRQEVVSRTLVMSAEPGTYELEITLLDQLLGYQTVYRDTLEVTAR